MAFVVGVMLASPLIPLKPWIMRDPGDSFSNSLCPILTLMYFAYVFDTALFVSHLAVINSNSEMLCRSDVACQ
jgi:hypothetical protein